ncbi:xanthine dehydrogenase family protein molybdopterin-binding subunit [Glacieibacterium megasporae]|uniref:xanthine dehydrogenase family protein molybdopterin-binding subunit n=1 Tax=Glacieibacterium megasporae TaxID=2835787 RepID=UPI001C1E26BA|nr:molybdopterin cofactor-binding domain-containing protein [Polymorphobacter megasporae]UAJ10795.1 molybdopterin-dependent oxidoreductase [Polymorphobacter megasporae]
MRYRRQMNVQSPQPALPPAKSRLRTTRRGFLIGTGAVAGLAVGYAVWPRRAVLNWAAAPDETVINGFVKIGTDGRVVVAIPQAEMGQGVSSALAQIVADELGADWNTVSVEPAPLNPIYANRGMALDATAGMPSALRGFARWGLGGVIDHFDVQMTGGSTSVRGFAKPMRLAGAAAREMLCSAAAREWGADASQCDTANGFVVYKANRIRFADIAGKVVQSDAPSSPVLRVKSTLMGKPVPRLDIPAKTDGSARFGIDVRVPGMVYAAVRSGPAGDPKLVSADAAKAKTLPGVIDVVHGPTWIAVVATTWFGANQALDAVVPVFAAQAKPAGPWVSDAPRLALTGAAKAVRDDGDAAGALAKGNVITADYTVPYLAHAALEPMNATARVDGDKVEVWAPTQSLSITTWSLAKALGVDEASIIVHPTLIGGSFGRKAEADASVQAALIARAVKRPVQLIYSRTEDLAQDRFRPAAAARMRGSVANGRIAAWDSRVAAPDVTSSFAARNLPAMAGAPKASAEAVDGATQIPYDLAHVRVEHALVLTPVPLGFWRSVGHSFSAFFVESFVDELAHAAGSDPGAFRLAMLKDQPRHAAVLTAALRAAGPLGQVEPSSTSATSGSTAGRGVALHESFGSIVAQVAEVECTKDAAPRVICVWAAIDCGPVVNPDGVRAQVEGAIAYGLGAALKGKITFADGAVEQTNFDGYPVLMLAEAPAIEVIIVNGEPGSASPMGGVGEPGTPPIAPAVANAIFAASGQRLRSLPFA